MKVLYFGVLSELTDKKTEEVELSGTVEDLRMHLIEKYPQIAEKRFEIAVNQKVAGNNQILSENDEIALLPPFTGG